MLNFMSSYDTLVPNLVASVLIALVVVFSQSHRSLLRGKKLELKQTGKTGYWRSLLFGVVFAAGWTPCIGPILAGILVVASQLDTVGQGMLLLVAYTLGLGIPFLLVGLAFGPLSSVAAQDEPLSGRYFRHQWRVAGADGHFDLYWQSGFPISVRQFHRFWVMRRKRRMLVFRPFVLRMGVGLLTLMLVLTGCVGQWTPEESAAITATVSAYSVPTNTPNPEVTAPPTPEPSPTQAPADTPTPVSVAPTKPPESNLPVGTQTGQLSPDFTLNDGAGQPVTLSALRGQPVVVIFWASWCTHCEKEMPLMQTMYEKYGDQGLQVVGVNVPGLGGDTIEKALAFVSEKDLSFPVVFDQAGQTYGEYGVNGVPNLFFIDRDGVMVATYPGAMDAERLEAQIKQLVEEG